MLASEKINWNSQKKKLHIEARRCESFLSILRAHFDNDTLDHFTANGTLPYLWHWLYTHETPLSAKLGIDGHPETLPQGVPQHFTRRLWASSTVNFLRPVTIGKTLTHTVISESVELKEGKSGPLAFVPLTIELSDELGLVISERRIGVYRPMPVVDSISSHQFGKGYSEEKPVVRDDSKLEFNEISLFQYSAILGVSHRIHYDFNYTTRVEGYSNLVVHGPLLAQMLLFYAIHKHSIQEIESIEIKCLRPNFLHNLLHLSTSVSSEKFQIIACSVNEKEEETMKLYIQLRQSQ